MIKKPSFIERLSGAIGGTDDTYDDLFDDAQGQHLDNEHPDYAVPQRREQEMRTMSPAARMQQPQRLAPQQSQNSWAPEPEGELAVDVYQTDDAIVVKALVAGVSPQNIDISLTRDMVTIKGTREPEQQVASDSYFQQELYWGSFSRTILLPEEVDVDMADASERHGILMVTLPKVNKARQAKLKVRSK